MSFRFVIIFLVALSISFSVFANAGMLEIDQGMQQSVGVAGSMKEVRFPGGLCYMQRITGMPDMVTYITTTPELANSPENLEKCLKKLAKQKFSNMLLEQSGQIDSLKEARTENMACTQVGLIQSPVMYVVKFFDYELTGKGEELFQCLYKMGESVDKAKQAPQGAATLFNAI